MISIRRALFVWMLCGLVVAGGLASVGTYVLVHNMVDEFFGDELRMFAFALVETIPAAKAETIPPPNHEAPQSRIVIRVSKADGTLLFGTPRILNPPRALQEGYTRFRDQSGQWHVYRRNLGGRNLVVAHQMQAGRDVSTVAALQTSLPVLVLIPVLGALFVYAIRRSFAPLNEVVLATARRDANHLAPLSMDRVPKEIVPLVREMNSLLARLGKTLEAQRRFVSDAAHELRMPLTALQLELGSLQQAAHRSQETESLARLDARVRRASHLVTQLLSMARREGGEPTAGFEPVELSALLKDCVIELLPLADQKRIDLGMGDQRPAQVIGNSEALRVLFANLLDNGIRYTPERGVVSVSVRRRGQSVVVEIEDSGPGIPDAHLERVFDRFFRVEGSGGEGSGLGLSIAHAIAEQHRAVIRLANRGEGGLLVEVTFSAAKSRV